LPREKHERHLPGAGKFLAPSNKNGLFLFDHEAIQLQFMHGRYAECKVLFLVAQGLLVTILHHYLSLKIMKRGLNLTESNNFELMINTIALIS